MEYLLSYLGGFSSPYKTTFVTLTISGLGNHHLAASQKHDLQQSCEESFSEMATMAPEYQSKMDFLLQKATSTARSQPPERKGEMIEAIDLWNTVHENLEHLHKTFSHAPESVKLQLAELKAFKHYCE